MAGAFEGQNGFLTNEFLVLKHVNPASFAKKKEKKRRLAWVFCFGKTQFTRRHT